MISAPEENNDIPSHGQDANANALSALRKFMQTLYWQCKKMRRLQTDVHLTTGLASDHRRGNVWGWTENTPPLAACLRSSSDDRQRERGKPLDFTTSRSGDAKSFPPPPSPPSPLSPLPPACTVQGPSLHHASNSYSAGSHSKWLSSRWCCMQEHGEAGSRQGEADSQQGGSRCCQLWAVERAKRQSIRYILVLIYSISELRPCV
jgi:hypothetical protein